MDKDTLSTRERDAWAELRAAIDRLTPEQHERPGANADGWSMKDVLWHIAHWWNDLTRMLGEMREGTFVEPEDDDERTNAENARTLEESRRMHLADVEQGVDMARGRMLAAWDALPEVTDPAERWFVWETIEHYEEHLEDARRFAEQNG
jgi:hypothetical protein